MPGQSHNPEAVERIVAYLRANEDRYAAEALDASLREAGYADADIEAARRRLSTWQVAESSPRPLWLRIVLAVLLTIVVIGVVAMAAALVVIGSCLFGYA